MTNDLNFYDEFKEWYVQIADCFKFDYQKDCESRDFLQQILSKKSPNWNVGMILESFKKMLASKQLILIYGCGPSLEDTVETLIDLKGIRFFDNFINLTADGASILLRENNIPIDAIFTDLDGITQNEFLYSHFNVVHAHGDNIDKLKLFEEMILNFDNIIGTTQVEPLGNVINPGGFTDGDRIMYFIHTLINPSQKLYLIGMDFKKIIGKYSKLDLERNQEGSLIKQKKLQFGVKLLEWLTSRILNDIYLVNSNKISDKFKYITLDQFLKNHNFLY
ncbi:MAG: 6-hydroxymethylpterin diphosphokinase MptE-like protein [Candidatus Thorarchaeota archaeon]